MAYAILDLGGTDTTAQGINDIGQVVGGTAIGGFQHAFLWQNGTMSDLGTLPGDLDSQAVAINDAGTVVGNSALTPSGAGAPGGGGHAFIWQSGKMAPLGMLAGETGSTVIPGSLNNAGQVVGTGSTGSSGFDALLWQAGTVTDLGALTIPAQGGFSVLSSAEAINDLGQGVGGSFVSAAAVVNATLWQNGQAIDLGGMPGAEVTLASTINNNGQLAGIGITRGTATQMPFFEQNGKMTPLPVLAPGENADPTAINAAGQIVGFATAGDGSEHAVTWQNGVLTDLNALLPADSGWLLETANAINSLGQIVGGGLHNGLASGFLLTPESLALTPAPATPAPQATLTSGPPGATVTGHGYDILDLSAYQSSQLTMTANADGSFTVDTNSGVGNLSNRVSGVLAVIFADRTVIVAPQGSTDENIALLYQGALGRVPDPAGLAAWEQAAAGLPADPASLADGSNGNSIVSGFTGSAEYQGKYGTLGDDQFVTRMYANVLDRQPDAAGFAAWQAAIAGGLGRDAALIGFATSAEAARNATAGFTGRSGDHAPWLLLT